MRTDKDGEQVRGTEKETDAAEKETDTTEKELTRKTMDEADRRRARQRRDGRDKEGKDVTEKEWVGHKEREGEKGAGETKKSETESVWT